MSFTNKEFTEACELAKKFNLRKRGVAISYATVESFLASIDSEMVKAKTVLSNYLEFIDSLPFKSGDPAFHKKFGNVIVKSIYFGEGPENKECKPIECDIVDDKGKLHTVDANILKPYGKANKVLYGENK